MPDSPDLIAYKKSVKKQLAAILPCLQSLAMGETCRNIEIPEEENEFTELLTAMNLLVDDLNHLNLENNRNLNALREAQKKLEEQLAYSTHQATENEELYHAMFNSSRDAIMTLTPPDWKFTSANPATLKLFEIKTESDFIATDPWSLSPEKQVDGELSKNKANKMIEKAMTEGSSIFEWTHRTTKGKYFPCTVLLSKITVGNEVFLQATVRDITEQKEKNDYLEKMNKFMVGRELKMVELKNAIVDLKKQLAKNK